MKKILLSIIMWSFFFSPHSRLLAQPEIEEFQFVWLIEEVGDTKIQLIRNQDVTYFRFETETRYRRYSLKQIIGFGETLKKIEKIREKHQKSGKLEDQIVVFEIDEEGNIRFETNQTKGFFVELYTYGDSYMAPKFTLKQAKKLRTIFLNAEKYVDRLNSIQIQ